MVKLIKAAFFVGQNLITDPFKECVFEGECCYEWFTTDLIHNVVQCGYLGAGVRGVLTPDDNDGEPVFVGV